MADIRSVETLIAAQAKGKKLKYVFFWGHTPRRDGQISAACFSQWYHAPFEESGQIYPTAEHYMMAEKARLFGDDEQLSAVLKAKSPGEAKACGRKVLGFDEKVWRQHRFDIVVKASVLKFGQDPALRDYLVGTGKRVLVEASPRDKIWGIGLAADHEHSDVPARWNGLNLLGFALMEARAQLSEMD